jgi:YhcH/YjgK/YiaL family protein
MDMAEGVFIVDDLQNILAYSTIGKNFARACEFVAKGDFSSLNLGRNEIEGDDIFVNLDETKYVAKDERKGELHRKYFDIHIPLDADELIGVREFAAGEECLYDEERDFSNQAAAGVKWLEIKRGQFAICWPKTCVHAPAVTTDVPKIAHKLIVKIKA